MKNSTTDDSTGNPLQKIKNYFRWSNQWFFQTPERALEQAYQAALAIKSIEDEHFDGQRVSASLDRYSQNILVCFQTDVKKYLGIIKLKLTEFQASRLFLKNGDYPFLEKLRFVDEIVKKYSEKEQNNFLTISNSNFNSLDRTITIDLEGNKNFNNNSQSNLVEVEPVYQKKGALPRSIGRTINKIKNELDNDAEEELVQNFRQSKRKTRQALRCILLLIIVPLLSQQISKQFFIFPLVEKYRGIDKAQIFINKEMKERAIKELRLFEETLKFENLLEQAPKLSSEEIETQIKEKANELGEEFWHESNSSISNVFADLIGIVAFAVVAATNQKGIIALKALMNEVMYNLSDSAKAFIIILFTDIFVGFHSPHGWEILLEGMASHLGLPASRSAIFLFIATFPVILDTILKYWIFRYLNQISPSAVATLKNMNE
jgi:hypothetical protein